MQWGRHALLPCGVAYPAAAQALAHIPRSLRRSARCWVATNQLSALPRGPFLDLGPRLSDENTRGIYALVG